MITKLTFTLYCVLLCRASASAQYPATGNSGATNGHVYGKIIEQSTQRAIDGATVLLFSLKKDSTSGKIKETVIVTQVSDKKGEFNFENLITLRNVRIRISATGFETYEEKINPETPGQGKSFSNDLDIGNIKLVADAKALDGITVNATRSLLQMSLDKKVYNVEKDLTAAGGTAVDVMKNVPSLNVDIDGNVTLRNAAPQIFVDGRPTTLTLEQIPADQISSVEIMTNPSAKYDASGGGSGILNIVLKKNRKIGYNGNIRSSIDSRGKPTFGGDINIKQNKINFFASGNLAFRKSKTQFYSNRTDTVPGGLVFYDQNSNPLNVNVFAFGRVGIDYLIDNRNTVTISANMVRGDFKATDQFNISSDSAVTGSMFKETINRDLRVKANFRNYGSAIGFKHNFARSGREFTADVNYNKSTNQNTSNYKNTLYNEAGQRKPEQGAQRATGGGSSSNYTFQTDYTDPFSKNQKIDLGVRATYRSFNNWNDNYLQNLATNLYELIPQIGVRYKYKDEVIAAYVSYSRQIDAFSFQTGLRAESSSYAGDFISKNQEFKNDYPLSLFPSAFLSYKLSDRQDVQLNYSRKINRPNFFQLIPFVDFSDSLNLSVGNPGLRPEFTSLVELAWSLQYKGSNSFLVSVYGKQTDDLITRYQFIDSVINPLKPGRYTSYANANGSTTAGIEFTGKNKLTAWWDLTSSINLFTVKIKAGNLTGSGTTDRSSWFGKLNNSFKLPHSFTFQLSGEYQAKTILPPASANSRGGGGNNGPFGGGAQTTAQGYLRPTYGVDFALRKDFLKNNAASLTLQFSDIFRTRVNATHSDAPGFSQDNYRYRDPQLLRLNFNYRFGKFDAALFKRKNTKSDIELQGIQGQP